MKVQRVKVNNKDGVSAAVNIEVDGFSVRITGGSYMSQKGNYPNIGTASRNAVPTRVARTLSFYLCTDGRIHVGQKESGRPASLPVVAMVDKLFWFTIEPDAKNLAKASAFAKDYVQVSVNKAPKSAALKPSMTAPTTTEEDDADTALYDEDELGEMSDEELRDLVEQHGRKLRNPQKIVDHLLTLTQEDALVDEDDEDEDNDENE